MKLKKGTRKVLIIIPIVLVCTIIAAWVTVYIYFSNSSIEKRFDSVVAGRNIYEAVLFVENTAGDFSESYGYGRRDIDSPLFTASITKIFTTACVLKLYEDGLLTLDDKISLYIDDDVLSDLHVYKDVEYSYDLTVSDLLFQTSGLPDAFDNIASDTMENGDRHVPVDEFVTEIKKLGPCFAPNSGKAYYNGQPPKTPESP